MFIPDIKYLDKLIDQVEGDSHSGARLCETNCIRCLIVGRLNELKLEIKENNKTFMQRKKKIKGRKNV